MKFVYTLLVNSIGKDAPLKPTPILLGTFQTKTEADREFNLYCDRMTNLGMTPVIRADDYARIETPECVIRVHVLASESK